MNNCPTEYDISNDINWELPDVQGGFRKGKGTRDQTANICGITEKASSV